MFLCAGCWPHGLGLSGFRLGPRLEKSGPSRGLGCETLKRKGKALTELEQMSSEFPNLPKSKTKRNCGAARLEYPAGPPLQL